MLTELSKSVTLLKNGDGGWDTGDNRRREEEEQPKLTGKQGRVARSRCIDGQERVCWVVLVEAGEEKSKTTRLSFVLLLSLNERPKTLSIHPFREGFDGVVQFGGQGTKKATHGSEEKRRGKRKRCDGSRPSLSMFTEL